MNKYLKYKKKYLLTKLQGGSEAGETAKPSETAGETAKPSKTGETAGDELPTADVDTKKGIVSGVGSS